MKRTLILILVLLGLIALTWYIAQERGSGTLKKELADFMVADTSTVDRLFIAEQGGGQIDLQRTSEGWMVNSLYPAKQHYVDLILTTLRRVEVRSPVPRSMQDMVVRVMSAKGKKVEIYQDGELLKTWYVGHATQDHFGTYMLLETPADGRSLVPFIMGMSGFTGFLTARFHTDVNEWRSSSMVHYPELSRIQQVRVQHLHDPEGSFTVTQQQGATELLDAQGRLVIDMDSLAVHDLLLAMRKLNFEYVENTLPRATKDSIINSTPMHTVDIRTIDGAEQHLRLFKRQDEMTAIEEAWGDTTLRDIDPDRMYSVVNDTQLVVVQRHLFDRIVPKLGRLRKKR